MRHVNIKFTFCIPLLLAIATLNTNAQQITVGVPSGVVNFYSAKQNSSQWCWAASIQMVLTGYGVNISQEQIVYRTYGTDDYGNLPNWGGSLESIHYNLNNWGIDSYGYAYTVQALMGRGAPTPATLIEQLINQRPVIIAYKTGPNSGHAVVVTAVSYYLSQIGPIITNIIVRDPWPSEENKRNLGRVVHSGQILADKIEAYWFINVIK
ncbi:MAG: papain-like cysteine protease family protein [Candidatus Kapaibacterium sp.]